LLEGEQPQGIAHQNRDAILSGATFDRPLQTANGEGIGCQAQIGFGFSASGGEPQEIGNRIGILTTIRVMQVSESQKIEQDKGQLEGTPAAIADGIDGLERQAALTSPFLGIEGMNALLPHGPVQKGEGSAGILVGREQIDACSNTG